MMHVDAKGMPLIQYTETGEVVWENGIPSEESHPRIRMSKNGLEVGLLESETDFVEMDGKKTGVHFSTAGARVISRTVEVFQGLFNKNGEKPLSGFVWSHMPSQVVLRRLGKKIQRTFKKAVDRFGVAGFDIPWVMKDIGLNNVSSVTPLACLTHHAREKDVPMDVPFLTVILGAGALSGAAVVEFLSAENKRAAEYMELYDC